ncbi:hypothetical protein F5Y09DRAFT_337370 [Xylaria sp. FL1042]|nr:hypothetical protein F5Y09DRAFT_337370 [Xylaria sp. FL1042]
MPAKSKQKEPTEAQTKREERQEKLRQAKKRQARYMETIAQLDENNCSLREILFTRGRPAYPAYDDSPQKRRKLRHHPKVKKLARRARGAKKPGLKKRTEPSPVSTPIHTVSLTPSCKLTELPTEILDEILRYRLLWPHEIVVFNGWERVYPRSRPRLDLSILYTCRMLRDQGLRILYGENQFEYNLRDPAKSHGHTNPVLDQVFGNSVVPINKYGHLIRYVKVKVHRNRLHFDHQRLSFERAILKFLPGGDLAHPANLHTLTLEVPALCNKDLEEDFMVLKEDSTMLEEDSMMLEEKFIAQKPDEVPICKYLRRGSKVGDALFKIRTQWVHVLAYDKYHKCWETRLDLRYFHKDEQMKLEYMALSENKKRSTTDVVNNLSIAIEPGADTSYRTKDVEAMEKFWGREVKDAVAGLSNLAGRIERLAIDPDLVIGKLGIWRPVDTTKSRGPRNNDRNGLVSLPSNWREPSSRINTRSGRGRTIPVRSNLDKSPSSGVQTKSKAKNKAKSNEKPRTTGKTRRGDLSILNTGDTVNEAKLLEAQQDIQEKETDANRSGMLTESWLESQLALSTENFEGSQYEEFDGCEELDTCIPEV